MSELYDQEEEEKVVPINRNSTTEEKVCAEIQYSHSQRGWVHSDICPTLHYLSEVSDMEQYKLVLHQCLDEWLDNSNGTGHFVIGASGWEEIKNG